MFPVEGCPNILFLCRLLNTFLLYLVPIKFRPSATKPNIVAPPPPRQPRRMDAKELQRIFEMFDKNGDGKITKSELSDSLDRMGIYVDEQELDLMIARFDKDCDGCVDIDEFEALYRYIMEDEEREGEDDDIQEAFNVFDQNRDGFITAEELRVVLAAMGLKQGGTTEDCRKMITTVDLDGDGKVDFFEFKQMMKGGLTGLCT